MITVGQGYETTVVALDASRRMRELCFAADDVMSGWNGRPTPEPGPHVNDGWNGGSPAPGPHNVMAGAFNDVQSDRGGGRRISAEAFRAARDFGDDADITTIEAALRADAKMKAMLGDVADPKPAPPTALKRHIDRTIIRSIASAQVESGAAQMKDADAERAFAAECRAAEHATAGMDQATCLAALRINERLSQIG